MVIVITVSMGIIFRIKKWLALKKAKKEEEKELPSKEETLEEEKRFLKEAKELKPMVARPAKNRQVGKQDSK